MATPVCAMQLLLARIIQQIFDQGGDNQNNNDPDGYTHARVSCEV